MFRGWHVSSNSSFAGRAAGHARGFLSPPRSAYLKSRLGANRRGQRRGHRSRGCLSSRRGGLS